MSCYCAALGRMAPCGYCIHGESTDRPCPACQELVFLYKNDVAEWCNNCGFTQDIEEIKIEFSVIPAKCDCGAAHTSNPNNHSTWCSIHPDRFEEAFT